MKLSELQTLLDKFIAEYGDLEVYTKYTYDNGVGWESSYSIYDGGDCRVEFLDVVTGEIQYSQVNPLTDKPVAVLNDG